VFAGAADVTWYLGHTVDVLSDGRCVLGGAHAPNTMYALQLDTAPASEALQIASWPWTCPEDALVVLLPRAGVVGRVGVCGRGIICVVAGARVHVGGRDDAERDAGVGPGIGRGVAGGAHNQ
jgi:hypothetical protein